MCMRTCKKLLLNFWVHFYKGKDFETPAFIWIKAKWLKNVLQTYIVHGLCIHFLHLSNIYTQIHIYWVIPVCFFYNLLKAQHPFQKKREREVYKRIKCKIALLHFLNTSGLYIMILVHFPLFFLNFNACELAFFSLYILFLLPAHIYAYTMKRQSMRPAYAIFCLCCFCCHLPLTGFVLKRDRKQHKHSIIKKVSSQITNEMCLKDILDEREWIRIGL